VKPRWSLGLAASLLCSVAVVLSVSGPAKALSPGTVRIDHVADGDTVTLTNGQRVRLVQIDTPEVYFGVECYGREASTLTKRMLLPGTVVRLLREPASDDVDRYGRLLRYVVRVRDGLNINLRLVAKGAAAPYFYAGLRGRFTQQLLRLARSARAQDLGLWGACPGTAWDPEHGVKTVQP